LISVSSSVQKQFDTISYGHNLWCYEYVKKKPQTEFKVYKRNFFLN